MATPLTDAINALTTYANSVTGASDTTLSDAVDTLAAGYGGGGGIDIADLIRRTQPSGAVVATLSAGAAEYGLSYMTGITSVHLTTPGLAGYLLQGSTNCKIFVGEGACTGNYNVFYNATGIETVDFSADMGAVTFSNNYFRYAKITKLILRKNSVVTLGATGAFNNTPFASSGAGGTLYVPSSLISSYQSASNWSTVLGYTNNSIVAIEGSEFESAYADGTPIS